MGCSNPYKRLKFFKFFKFFSFFQFFSVFSIVFNLNFILFYFLDTPDVSFYG